MRHIRLIHLIAGAFLIFSLLAVSYALSEGKADIRGTVTHIRRVEDENRKHVLGSVLIEGVRGADTQVDKAKVTVTSETRLFIAQDEGRKPASFADLKEGQKVEAHFVGPVLESYPVQATAGEIIILRR